MARWTRQGRGVLFYLVQRLHRTLEELIPACCAHHRGHGGVKGAVRSVHSNLEAGLFVARFDIASYYDSMQHGVVLDQLAEAGVSELDLRRVAAYLRLPDRDQLHRGIVAGGGLSPLLGGLYLTPLDRAMSRRKARGQLVGYVRYMDDIVLMARTRWHLRKAIAELHERIRPLGLRLHRVKRFVGRASDGFDFLGYRFRTGRRLRPSRQSLDRLRTRARRLHERGADLHRLRQYVVRWWKWLHGGLCGLVSRRGWVSRTYSHILFHLRIDRSMSRAP